MPDFERPVAGGGATDDVPRSLPLAGGLFLRPLTLGDAPIVYRTVDEGRADLHAWLPWVEMTDSVADTLRFIEESSRQRETGGAYVYGLWLDLDFCGAIDLHAVDRVNGNAQIGYWLKQSARGHGLMTSATVALAAVGFEILGLERIEIRVATGNDRSAAIPIRLGFQHEGVLRHAQRLDTGYADLNVYGLLADEYRERLSGLADASADEIEGGLEF